MAEPPLLPPPQMPRRRVRSWWLCFISAWYVPVWLTQSVIQITLPAQVAVFVPSVAEQYTMLGVASAIGAAMQFAQPFVGAVSDRTRGRAWGGRRTYLVVGQLLSVVGLALMATARGVWWLTWGYALLMFGSSIVSTLVMLFAPAERQPWNAPRGGGGGKYGPAPVSINWSAEEIVSKLDQNGDGVLEADEVHANLMAALQKLWEACAPHTEQFKEQQADAADAKAGDHEEL